MAEKPLRLETIVGSGAVNVYAGTTLLVRADSPHMPLPLYAVVRLINAALGFDDKEPPHAD